MKSLSLIVTNKNYTFILLLISSGLFLSSCKSFNKLPKAKQDKYFARVGSKIKPISISNVDQGINNSKRFRSLTQTITKDSGTAGHDPALAAQLLVDLRNLSRDSAITSIYYDKFDSLSNHYQTQLFYIGIFTGAVGLVSSTLTGLTVGTLALTYTASSVSFLDGLTSVVFVPIVTRSYNATNIAYNAYSKDFNAADSLISQLTLLRLEQADDSKLLEWHQLADQLHRSITNDFHKYNNPSYYERKKKK